DSFSTRVSNALGTGSPREAQVADVAAMTRAGSQTPLNTYTNHGGQVVKNGVLLFHILLFEVSTCIVYMISGCNLHNARSNCLSSTVLLLSSCDSFSTRISNALGAGTPGEARVAVIAAMTLAGSQDLLPPSPLRRVSLASSHQEPLSSSTHWSHRLLHAQAGAVVVHDIASKL
ncbi:hypothetical protein S83_036447, partial [Arachis hypogaea]